MADVPDDRQRLQQNLFLTRLGRWGRPEDIAAAVSILVSDKACQITGPSARGMPGVARVGWIPGRRSSQYRHVQGECGALPSDTCAQAAPELAASLTHAATRREPAA